MCESDEQYVPLNEGYNWKGDPNATLSGQGVPQDPPGAAPPLIPAPAPTAGPEPAQAEVPSPIAVATYDPATGEYIGPDGHRYTQANLATSHPTTWQAMLIPPTP
jgi:phospholipid/cholesterol/gamma-HCH transport system substrate-binding protein